MARAGRPPAAPGGRADPMAGDGRSPHGLSCYDDAAGCAPPRILAMLRGKAPGTRHPHRLAVCAETGWFHGRGARTARRRGRGAARPQLRAERCSLVWMFNIGSVEIGRPIPTHTVERGRRVHPFSGTRRAGVRRVVHHASAAPRGAFAGLERFRARPPPEDVGT